MGRKEMVEGGGRMKILTFDSFHILIFICNVTVSSEWERDQVEI